ncbi:hypothetical protein BN130_1452 [Cronobacter malonaticus 507]|nr:hypothetical protein BN130_1452 [Cronobacter malonaticus 507]
MAARRVVNGNRRKAGFASHPGVGDGALLGVNRLLHRRAAKLHITAEIEIAAKTTGHRAHIKVRNLRLRAGGGYRQQRKRQRVVIQPALAANVSDLFGAQHRRKMSISNQWSQSGLQCRRQLCEGSFKTLVHGKASKEVTGKIVYGAPEALYVI